MKSQVICAALLLVMTGSVYGAPANYPGLPGIANLLGFREPARDLCLRKDWYSRAQWSLRKAHRVREKACTNKHWFVNASGKKRCQKQVNDDYQYSLKMLEKKCSSQGGSLQAFIP